MKRFLLILSFCLLVFPSPSTSFAAGLDAVVSILPQQYFVKAVGGDRVSVKVMVAPGANPHVYEPKPSQMAAVGKADVYFSIGVAFEDVRLPKFKSANADMLVVPCDQGVEKIPMAAHHHEAEAHHDEQNEEQHHHEHGMLDPHIWTAPGPVKVIARNIRDGLVRLDPEGKATYNANLEAFLAEVDEVDARIKEALTGLENKSFLVFHPAWGYFAHHFGLQQIAIEIEGKEPGPKELARVITFAREHNIKVLFVQPQISESSARTIARELNAQVVPLDPLAKDWIQNMNAAAQAFRQALE